MADNDTEVRATIAADIDAPDKVLYGLTFRQLAILAVAAVAYYGLFQALRHTVAMIVLVGVGVIGGALAFGLAVGRRDGQNLDAWVWAALRYRRSPRTLIDGTGSTSGSLPGWAPDTVGTPVVPARLRLPAGSVDADGQIATDGRTIALVATTTVNLGLRTTDEQASLVDGFGRWLNSLNTGTQIVVSAQPVDLSVRADRLRATADRLPHPALAAACTDHAAFLDELAERRDPLRRQVLIATSTAGGETGGHAARRRADDTARTLSALGVTAQPLDAGGVAAALAAAVDPFTAAPPGARAATDTPITAARPAGRRSP